MAKLLVQESNGAREFELVDNEINIGRELDNSLRLADPSISRHHAVLRRTAAGYEIQDLGSSNGVLINGIKVETGSLKDGDRITLGQMQLTFVDPRPADEVNPLGTIRMSLDEMAKLQSEAPAPVPIALASEPPPPPAPLPPPPPPHPQASPQPSPAPRVAVPQGDNPAPPFLQAYLPPIPDDAQPLITGGAIERGDFGTRFVAWLIDGCIGVLVAILFVVAVAILGAVSHGLGLIFGCLLYPLVGIGYLVFTLWCTVRFRATIGKKIMKLRIVPEMDPTGNIDWGQALLRYLGHWVSGMLACLPYLLILASDRKGFQDMFSNSIVIKVDR